MRSFLSRRIAVTVTVVVVALSLALTSATAFAAPQDSPSAWGNCTYVRVGYGQTLSGIAWKYGTSAGAIAAASGIANPNWVRAGSVVCVPSGYGGGYGGYSNYGGYGKNYGGYGNYGYSKAGYGYPGYYNYGYYGGYGKGGYGKGGYGKGGYGWGYGW
ncbi:MAG: LysM peptidoglycan-binding domain-containing protein [Chloroflexi bacterium]|nr:LysM peptidoglycan-binding domain-containing protein [Chloroflexota bacterium]